ncbi:uncharacterized protein LOC105183901, partial [Harpegnathos saltator]
REDEARPRNRCKIKKRLKTLFCCIKPRESHEEVIEYDPDEYDYIIEKLVVKRVPLALFAIRADLLDHRHGSDVTMTSEQTSRSASSSTFGKRSNFAVSTVAQGSTSMKTTTDSSVLSHRTRSSAWRKEILDKFSALYPDLKESERLSKDPLNSPQSKQSFTGNVSGTSRTGTDVSSEQISSAVVKDKSVHRGRPIFGFSSKRTEKSDGSRQPRDASSEKDRSNCFPGVNLRYVVLPFRVRSGSFDLEKQEKVHEDTGVNCKSLMHLGEFVEDKTLQPVEASKDYELPNTAVRWRITIRRQRANADSDAVAPEVMRNSQRDNENI